ncbi:MAG: tRNA pseudouridine(38-40) synthase TruA [Bacilli bacterium]|nr:tRNA pseudouridine(38-40) synthase TruA [Bacilli bacterium]
MKILAKVEYLGTNYHGWQKQIDASSVQEEIEKVLSQIFNKEINIYGSGRTDAGVHAKGQTFHFEVDKDVDLGRLKYSTNMLLPNDIHIISFERVSDDFHARFSAQGKHYQYRINTADKNPFNFNTTYHYPYPLNIALLKVALEGFKGKHNFQDFTSKEEDEDGFVREISDVLLTQNGKELIIDFFGSGFMRYMIRYIVGTALAIASGKEDIKYIKDHLDSSTREITSYKAGSEGLFLIDVIY